MPESGRRAREGLVHLEVVAGDGTKLKASASIAANVTAEQLEAQIAELEELIESGVRCWVAEHLAVDDADVTAAPRRAPGGDGPAGGAGRGGTKPSARAAMVLQRRQAARRQLAARHAEKEQPGLDARAAGCAARAQRKAEAAGLAWQVAAGKLAAWEAKAAGGVPPRGRKPQGPEADWDVRRTRAQADKARAQAQAAAAAVACPAVRAGTKVN